MGSVRPGARGGGRPAPGAAALAVTALALVLMAFMKVSTSDPLASVGGRQSVYEVGLLALSTALLAVGRGFRMPPPALLLGGPVLPVLLYALLGVASALWSPGPALSFGKGMELLALTLNALLFAVLLRDAALVPELPGLVAVSVFAVVALFLALNLALYGTPIHLAGDEAGRARLVLGQTHPLVVGDLAALGFLAALASGFRRGARGLLLVAFGLLLALSKARGSLLATAIATLMFAAGRSGVRSLLAVRARSGLAAAAVVAAVLVGALASPGVRRFLYDLSPDVETLNGRLDLWSAATSLAADRPFLGYGYYASRYVLLDIERWGGHTHQTPLEVLLTTGAVGLALLAWLVAAILPLVFRSIFLFTLGAYLAVVCLVSPVLLQPGMGMYLLTVAAAAVLLHRSAGAPGGRAGHAPARLVPAGIQ